MTRCPAHTSAMFKPVEKGEVSSHCAVRKALQTEKYPMTRDV